MKKRRKNYIINNLDKYEKLRKNAHNELKILETYFGKRQIDQIKIYSDILRHLEATQKEISYFGLRGVYIGLATAIFVYIFNTQIAQNLVQSNTDILGNQLLGYILNLIGAIITIIVFLLLYFLATGDIFISDWKRRNQIYINEYMIKLVQEKIDELKEKRRT
ncbi:hypothetical protein [Neobacillus bataviensis]|uniref:hypothetical protein n=1 Tax=Neobacillus bataviensis TaxID=220685 RepID=UPI001CBD909F|nr:hypothetical protein [Neobacillus bataviensis]